MKKLQTNIFSLCADYPILCTIIAAFCWFVFSAFEMYVKAKEFYYIDTDCYARYLRITDWLEGDFSWFEKIYPFTNCPYGEILHFTRINDVLWLIFSLPFFVFLPFKQAVFAGGLVFSPILFVATLVLIMCGLKKYLGMKDFKRTALFIFIFSFVFLLKTMVFSFGRPDHHSLMIFIAAFLCMALLLPTNKKMFLSGIAAAMGIWASSAFEGMLLAYMVIAVLCIGIIFYKHSFDYVFYYTLGMFIGVSAAYILNPPFEGYLYFDNARLSLIHVVICGLTFAVFTLCRHFNLQGIRQKIAAILTGAIISFGILLAIFGIQTIFAPIYDEKIIKYFIPYIQEMQPISVYENLYFVFGSIEILILWRCFECKSFDKAALYILFFAYLPFCVLIQRFLPYGILFYVLINVFMLTELFKRLINNEKYKIYCFICIIINLFFMISYSYTIHNKIVYPKLSGCVLSDIFIAPQLIYETGVKTIGSPYHRNTEGIVDTVEIFAANDETEIKEKLKKRGVKYIIIPSETIKYLENLPKNSFYKSLKRGQQYDWLSIVNEQREDYKFFEVIDEKF